MSVNSTHNSQRGSVLLYAVLILTIMVTVGFGLASVIYREVLLGRVYPDSLQAFYAAESGTEQNLDALSEHRKNGGQLDEVAATNDGIDIITRTTGGVGNPTYPETLQASEAIISVDTTATHGYVEEMEFPLVAQQTMQIDMYDPDNYLRELNAQSVQLLWNEEASCSPSAIEVSLEELNVSSLGLSNDLTYKDQYQCSTPLDVADSAYDCELVLNWPVVSTNYLVRVKALNCDIPLMNVQFYQADDATGNVEPIPSVVDMTAIGEGQLTQQRIRTVSKWVPQAQGVADFVLFAIEKIDKSVD